MLRKLCLFTLCLVIVLQGVQAAKAEQVDYGEGVYIDGIESVSQRLADLEFEVAHELKRIRQQPAKLRSEGYSGLIFSYDYLLWTVRQQAVQYAIQDIGGVQDRGAVGPILAIGGNYESGNRFRFGNRFRNGLEVSGIYTHFDSTATETQIGSVRSIFVSSDNSENNDSDDNVNDITPDDRATRASATSSFEIDTYDLEVATNFKVNDSLTVRVGAKGRYADIHQQFEVTYTGGDFQVPFSPFRTSEYQGGGILFMTESRWRIYRGLTLNAGLSGGMMIGGMQTQTFIPDDEPGVPTNVTYSETRASPIIEVSASVKYRHRWGRWLLNAEAGYEMANWFNLADERVFTDSHQEGQNVHLVNDFTLDGLFVRGGINY